MKRVIDATNARVGRLATVVAKSALLGDDIVILNCGSAIISGSKKCVEAKWKARAQRGQPHHGPFMPRMPDRFLRRIIRGMLPYKQPKGRDAFQKIMCYLGVPEEFKDEKLEKIELADLSRLRGTRYVTVKELCHFLGGRTE